MYLEALRANNLGYNQTGKIVNGTAGFVDFVTKTIIG